MNDVQIEQLRVPETLDGDGAADFLRAVDVSRQVRLNTWGNDDLAYTGAEMLALCHDPYEWYVMLVARLGGEIVGRAGVAMPLDDDTELAHVTLDVLPSAQGHGIGRKLLEAAETFVQGENRHIVVVETNHSAADAAAGGEDAVPAANGAGSLPLSSREARFAFSAGYQLEQVEQFSSCALPLNPVRAQELSDGAKAAQAGKYDVHGWTDHCPDRWAADVVRLERGQDPEGGNTWDVARLRESEELSLQTGRHTLVSAAECVATGSLVGFTSISVLGYREDVVFQDDTVLAEEHRGQELGLRIKVANMERLAREFPQSRTVYTWNAADNAYMLAVNAKLGFAAAGITGQWQKDFAAAL
ncbi:GNAT family N-acetyltransferase [Arthrobacter silviterrae]|uniref:GNAT family N-acetyltransferase n=1 Tax=Arthrobacter silviterrae TaxID=2026658 RepID=A0ABX0DBF6_9MICC|nr:GNAT family N-acetyltransferase [Arthrobacter silviterrae]NGN84238.1 GNAT family N-acetyltransferase [Arthrobacter silviterrae]